MQTTHGAFTKMFLKPLRSAILGLSFTTAWVIESMSAGAVSYTHLASMALLSKLINPSYLKFRIIGRTKVDAVQAQNLFPLLHK